MNLAIDYLIRTNLIKDWLVIPCSLFLQHKDNDQKLVLTINEEFKKSNYFSIKYWRLFNCTQEQSLPPMEECRVLKDEIFFNPLVILSDYNLLRYKEEFIGSYHNEFNHPMSSHLYSHLYEQIINGRINQRTRINWLWRQFAKVYSINLNSGKHYISSVYCSEDDLANEQRNIVCTNMKKEWQCWELWQKYLLLNPG